MGSYRNQVKDPRVWNREKFRRLENESFSIFLDNLPKDILKRELYQLFSWTGRINDIYLSRKQKRGMIYMFAFIRYTTKGGALKAITEMNRLKLRGKEVFVGEAKYRRLSDTKDMKKIQSTGGNQNDMICQPPRESTAAQITPSSCPEDVTNG
ncbi:serine/arginine-rich splicing factor SC35-like [Arachis duranensis]|uniref:Serine/arginine-rich splicing factor SC35-like n=1 Tax=Arachis duranensis TaxID=130453 RepID=A0A6P4D1Q7_ARADU|nr:serine/arginine-rich splicing factor SC35-like [Arachis duranensis]